MFPLTEENKPNKTAIDRHRKGAKSRLVSNYEHNPCPHQRPLANQLDPSQSPSSPPPAARPRLLPLTVAIARSPLRGGRLRR